MRSSSRLLLVILFLLGLFVLFETLGIPHVADMERVRAEAA